MREWVAQEDNFVLKQAKKKAEIRVKEGRAKPIDWLAVNLRVIDPERNPLDDEIADEDLDVVDPEGLLESLDDGELDDLEKEIDTYLGLEKNKNNQEFWNVSGQFLNHSQAVANLPLDNEDHMPRSPRTFQACFSARGSSSDIRSLGH